MFRSHATVAKSKRQTFRVCQQLFELRIRGILLPRYIRTFYPRGWLCSSSVMQRKSVYCPYGIGRSLYEVWIFVWVSWKRRAFSIGIQLFIFPSNLTKIDIRGIALSLLNKPLSSRTVSATRFCVFCCSSTATMCTPYSNSNGSCCLSFSCF